MRNLRYLLFGLIISVTFSSCGYNKLVTYQEEVGAQWANVENAYQRRADLIPNLVKTVKANAEYEQKTLQAVIDARANATKMTLNVDQLDEASIAKFNKVQGELSSTLNRLLATFENYPNLKATKGFGSLMAQLEGSENRIAVERRKFNKSVQQYNQFRRQFPQNLSAGMFGFNEKAYFEAEEGAEKAPKVDFE